MASNNKLSLLAATALTAASTTGSGVALDNSQVDYVGVLTVSAQHADTDVDVKLQTSSDGTNWIDWVTFTQQTGSGSSELKLPTDNAPGLAQVRYVVALSGTTKAATVKIELAFRNA